MKILQYMFAHSNYGNAFTGLHVCLVWHNLSFEYTLSGVLSFFSPVKPLFAYSKGLAEGKYRVPDMPDPLWECLRNDELVLEDINQTHIF